jgi:hypothetical protein
MNLGAYTVVPKQTDLRILTRKIEEAKASRDVRGGKPAENREDQA